MPDTPTRHASTDCAVLADARTYVRDTLRFFTSAGAALAKIDNDAATTCARLTTTTDPAARFPMLHRVRMLAEARTLVQAAPERFRPHPLNATRRAVDPVAGGFAHVGRAHASARVTIVDDVPALVRLSA